ncbi:MAG: LamG-like jellyroll fold domain-containing protein, partial [Candidatus Zixiibacteriota bacterium]
MSAKAKRKSVWAIWSIVLVALAVVVLWDISSTVAQKRSSIAAVYGGAELEWVVESSKKVHPALFDPIEPPAPKQNSVVGICQSTDPALGGLSAALDATLSYEQVDSITRLTVQRAGGLEDVVQPGEWVVVKPNILYQPGTGGYNPGIVTDLRVIKSVIEQLIEEGDASRITVAEGKQWTIESGGWQAVFPAPINMSYEGMITDLDTLNPGVTIDYIDLDYPPYTGDVPVPGGGLSQDSYTIPDAILNCDRLIAVAVMKTHTWARLTLTNKLYIGISPASVYSSGGFNHMALNHSLLDMTICDLVSYHPADFAMVECIWGIEGDGPAGSGVVKRNLVIAGKDLVATDAVSAAAMGFNPWDIDYLHWARNKGFGTYDLDYITVNGPSIDDIRYNFAKPRRDDPDPGYALGFYQGRCNRIWLINGFHDEYGADINYDYLGGVEATISPVPGDSTGGEVWTVLTDVNEYMDLQSYFEGGASDCITYAFTRVIADSAMAVYLRIGSDDGIKVWLNGDSVYANVNTGGWSLVQQTVAINLVQGVNRLLVKVKNTTGAYGFSMSVSESDGDTPFGILYSVTPTPAPEVVLNSPSNGAQTSDSFMDLSATVTDADGDSMVVRFYGGMDDASDLLYLEDSVPSGTLLSYNWDAPVMPVDTNTSGLWHFNEASGDTVYDATVYGHNGFIHQAQWVKQGKFGPCLYFDGMGNVDPNDEDYVLIADTEDDTLNPTPTDTLLDGMSQLTLEAWIYVASPLDEPYYGIWKKWGPNTNPELWSYAMVVMQDRRLYWHLQTDDSYPIGPTVITNTLLVPLYEWVHVAGTYDGSSGVLILYINGVQDPATQNIPGGGPVYDSPVGVHIGAAPYLEAQYFHGYIDEPRIITRVLSPQEIQERVRLGNGRYYWRVTADDGSKELTTSETRYFDVGTGLPPDSIPPEVTLNYPPNDSTTTNDYMGLSATVSDANPMTVRFYGNTTDASDLLYVQENVVGTDVTYNWTDPVMQVETGTQGLWHFSEGSGSATYDQTINDNDGTISGATWTSDGRFGYALDFDGVDDYVEVPDDASLNSAGPMTIEAWIKPSGAPLQYSEIVDKEGTWGYSFILNDDRLLHLWVGDGTDWINSVGTTVLQDDSWYYVVGVSDGDSIRVYVNGVQEGTATAQGSPESTAGVPLRIGRGNGSLLRWFNGIIDEVRFSNRALTPSEIAANYAGGLSEGRYYWKVAVSDGQNDSTSETRYFNVGVYPGPPIPNLINPSNLALIGDNTPTFEWSSTAGVGGEYTLQYALDAGFTTGVQTVSGISDTNYTVPAPDSLSDDTYYWHVQAFDFEGDSSNYQSTPFSFTVDTQAPEVTLNYPPNDSTTTNDYMELSATVSDEKPMTVSVYGDQDPDPTTLLYQESGLPDPSTVTHLWGGGPQEFEVDVNTGALWHFNENTGTTAYDQTANDNDGAISGATWTTDSRFGYALDFDGLNDYVEVPADPSLDITGPITIEAWIKPSGDPVEYSEIVDKEPVTQGPGYSFILNNDRLLNFWIGESGTDWLSSVGTTALQDDTWYYVVGVNDGDSIRVYVDGVQEGTPTEQGPPGSTAGVNLQIGRGGTSLQRWFNGIIDEIRISNRALPPSEIATNYAGGLTEGRYYWKVTASDGVNDSTSETRYFNVGVPSGPPIPALITPPDLATITDNTPTFVWSSTAGVGGDYTLQYALDAGFTTGVRTVTDIPDTTYTVPTPDSLSDDTYYWHVQAFDSEDSSRGYQPTPFSFTVNTTPPDPPEITLNSPPDDSTTQNPSMALDFTVTDPNNDPMTVWVYGDTADASDLLYVEEDVVGTDILYDWTAQPLGVDASAVCLWRFDEGTGNSVYDETAYNNNGVIDGATWTANGRFGYALDFDGVNDAVIVPDAPELDGMSELTLEAWINLASDPTDWEAIVQKWSTTAAADYTYTLVVSASNNLYIHFFTDVEDVLFIGSLELPLYTWTHVAATYDGTVVRLYVNGVQDPVTGNLTGTIRSNDWEVNIGACLPYGSEYFDGMIDEVRILTRALTAEEIAADAADLPEGTYYWKVAADDGSKALTVSETRYFNIVTPAPDPPEITLNSPPNDSTTENPYMDLDFTVTDPNNDPMTVWVYADTGDASDLLYVEEEVVGTDITYSWADPVMEVESGTQSLWHFSEGSGPTTYDQTTNDNDGTISGATWTADGRFGYALDFNGLSDYVQVPADPSLDITGPITIEAWIKPSGNPIAYSEIVDKEPPGAGPGYSFMLNNDRLLHFWVGDGADWTNSVGTTALQDDIWYYVVGVHDGDSIRVYVNGVQEGTPTEQGPPGSTAGVNLQIGRGGSALERWFNGIIDEVRISDRALTAEEIAANYAGGLSEGTYYWHVEADDGSKALTVSETRYFNVGEVSPPPDTPTLINPPDVALINDNTPTFDWSSTAGVGGDYTLQYALDAGFTTGVQTVSGISDTTYTVPAPSALSDDLYYWHVQAFNSVGDSSGYQTTPFSFTVDTEAPDIPTLINPPDLAAITDNTPTFDWSSTAGSGGAYTLEYALDAGFTTGVQTIADIAEITYTIPDPDSLSDNTYFWHVQAFDQVGNPSGYQATPFSFTIDKEAPGPPTDFTVEPGHEKCKLSWTNPTGDPSFEGVEIRRNPWEIGAYPEYDDDFPTPIGYPTDETEGDLVYQGSEESFRDSSDTGTMPRNVYYYSIFSYDAAGNYSTLAVGDTARGTNYWLGDVTGDGSVYYEDLTFFSNAFRTSPGEPGYDPEFDIGPTYSMSPKDIPTTDDVIDFED